MLFTEEHSNDVTIHWMGANGLPFSIKCQRPRKENIRMSFLHDDRLHVYNPKTNRLHVLVGTAIYQVTPDGVYTPSRAKLVSCPNIMRVVDRLTYLAVYWAGPHLDGMLVTLKFTDYGGWYAHKTRSDANWDTLCYSEPCTALQRRCSSGDQIVKIATLDVFTGNLKSESMQPGDRSWLLMLDACDGMLLVRRSIDRIIPAHRLYLYNLNTGDMLMDLFEHIWDSQFYSARFVGKNIVYIVASVDGSFIHTMINLTDGSVFTQSSRLAD
jgi:hypothetical protein